MYSIGRQLYLNEQSGEYETILTIDRMPSERTPLRNMVRSVRPSALSPYQYNNGLSNPCSRMCMYALTRPDYMHNMVNVCGESPFMNMNDLPILITLLRRSGYQVDGSMSTTNVRGITGSDVVCYVSIGSEGVL
jgi:hypothetical protein